MESFLLQIPARHQHLVKRFKPKPGATKSENTFLARASVQVATRIRPILEDEASSGQVPAAFPRSGEDGTVDLHELRRVVRGPPPLNVSQLLALVTLNINSISVFFIQTREGLRSRVHHRVNL